MQLHRAKLFNIRAIPNMGYHCHLLCKVLPWGDEQLILQQTHSDVILRSSGLSARFHSSH
jgi:hypothetical protein